MTMELLPNQQAAKEFVLRITTERAKRILTQISNRIQRRIETANASCQWAVMDNTNIRTSPLERELIARIKLGMQLTSTDTPTKARQRNLKRFAERKARRKASLK